MAWLTPATHCCCDGATAAVCGGGGGEVLDLRDGWPGHQGGARDHRPGCQLLGEGQGCQLGGLPLEGA